jgi:apolipoprotein N-acyltransferase
MSQKGIGRSFWSGMGASIVSGVLISMSMPNFDVGILGWVALVPLLIAIMLLPDRSYFTLFSFLLAMPFGLIWSISAHSWYLSMFSTGAAYGLIFGVASWYAGLIAMGAKLHQKLPENLKILALPTLWAALEFIKFIAPVVENWWFVLFAKSQWRFPPALQILSYTGFPGLSFLLVLTNLALATLLIKAFRNRSVNRSSVISLVIVATVIIWGTQSIPVPPDNTFPIVATVGMSNQDEKIMALGKISAISKTEGPYADTPEMSQAIFDVNAALTRSTASIKPAFVVWPENEFADADDPTFVTQIGKLAKEMNSYIVADMVWRAPTGMHDTALMVGPGGNEVGRRAKIAVTDGEKNFGFVPGPNEFPIFETPYGKVGLGVCWDRHRLWITRELARSGAQIVLMPVDDDFNRNSRFPAYHASDAVFRAVENRVAFGLGTTSGIALVIDPYGRITAESGVNKRTVISGPVFTTPERTIYTRFGDWFGWLMVAGLIFLVGLAIFQGRISSDDDHLSS